MPFMKKVLGIMLMVSIFTLSDSALIILILRLELVVIGTGIWALLQKENRVKTIKQNILPNQLNSSVFN
jgi:hypothetical protein